MCKETPPLILVVSFLCTTAQQVVLQRQGGEYQVDLAPDLQKWFRQVGFMRSSELKHVEATFAVVKMYINRIK